MTTEDESAQDTRNIILCLSGGGYRAMLFHAGVILRLFDAQMLSRVKIVSAVSGGALLAAHLGLIWDQLLQLQSNPQTNRAKVRALLFDPPLELAKRQLDVYLIVFRLVLIIFIGLIAGFGLFLLNQSWMTITIGVLLTVLVLVLSEGWNIPGRSKPTFQFPRLSFRPHLDWALSKHNHAAGVYSLKDKSLADLPKDVEFRFNATNINTGEIWAITREFMGDAIVGYTQSEPHISLATVVACSAAFPPFLSPIKIPLKDYAFNKTRERDDEEELHRDELAEHDRTKLRDYALLADGGLYDNLGMAAMLQRWQKKEDYLLLISDGGGKSTPNAHQSTNWLGQVLRVIQVTDAQSRDQRLRGILKTLFSQKSIRATGLTRGVYWSTYSNLENLSKQPSAASRHFLYADNPKETGRLATLSTRLWPLTRPSDATKLINWGYAVTDAKLRVFAGVDKEGELPYKKSA